MNFYIRSYVSNGIHPKLKEIGISPEIFWCHYVVDRYNVETPFDLNVDQLGEVCELVFNITQHHDRDPSIREELLAELEQYP